MASYADVKIGTTVKKNLAVMCDGSFLVANNAVKSGREFGFRGVANVVGKRL